jgi:citrate lyase subunit beta/citryl-CoA lyase
MRSLLFSPGDSSRMLAKARDSGADALIFDLEDAVAEQRKDLARALVGEHLHAHEGGPAVFVRVNGAGSGRLAGDLDAVTAPGLDGVWLPKAEEPAQVAEVAAQLDELEARRGLKPGAVALFATFETARGVWYAHEIALASPRLAGVSVGTAQGGDLEADLGCRLSDDGRELDHVRSRVLLAAKAAGVHAVIDGAYTDFRSADGLLASATAASRLGYTGKMAIHPGQVATLNAVFSPTPAEVDYAERVIAAFDAALERGSAATSVDGKMIDYAMAATARSVLRRAAGERVGHG